MDVAPGMDAEVWMVVSIAAVHAMDYGRRLLWDRRRGPHWPEPVRQEGGVTALYAVDALAIVAQVAAAAAARFWETLWDVAATAPAQAHFSGLGQGHPFLYCSGEQAGGHGGGVEGGRLRARVPEGGAGD